ncbi:beta-amylase [Ranunculus cassubicifolius]
MATISSPSPSSISASLSYKRFTQFPSTTTIPFRSSLNRPSSFPRFTIQSYSDSSKRVANPSSITDPYPDYEIHHETPVSRWHKGSLVYVTLPIDTVDFSGKIKRLKTMMYSFKALALSGVEGVVMEVWWGLVERDVPMTYDWKGYLEIVALARHFGLKVRAVMAFHELGVVGDPHWIPLPYWVRQAMIEQPDLAYSDRFGRRNKEYISLGCDVLPVLRGRSPIQAYSDFMRSFRDAFKEYLGVTLTGVQVGMGPAGELRYPSCPSQKLEKSWRFRELGEFQCYDKYMLASLDSSAQEIGMHEWGNGGPLGTGNLMHNPEETEFFRSDGSWDTPYGRFFLEWYSGMLLLHGERLCAAAENIFWGTGVSISAKLAGMHWHYRTESHPSELTAGYYNTSIRDGYLPIARLFGRYGVILCCSCFELRDLDENLIHPCSSPESLLRQILLAARASDLPLDAENSGGRLNDQSLQQILKMSRFYSDGLDELFFSFNFVRMSQNLFEQENWFRFTEFVKQISPTNGSVQAKLNLYAPSSKRLRTTGAYC